MCAIEIYSYMIEFYDLLTLGVDVDSAPPMPSFDDPLDVNDHSCHMEADSENTSDDDNISGIIIKLVVTFSNSIGI